MAARIARRAGLTLVGVMVTVGLAGCGNGSDAAAGGGPACAAPAASVAPPALPDGIPWPAGVVATAIQKDSARQVVDGYAAGTADATADRFRTAFASHQLLTLGSPARSGNRTTVAVGGPSTTGTITLTASCEGRVDVRLELRPLAGG